MGGERHVPDVLVQEAPMARLTTLLAVTLLVLGMLAGPALAKNGNNGNNGGNSLRAQSTAVDVTVTEVGDWYRVQHDLNADAATTVWNEPVKYANENQQASGVDTFDALWLYGPSHAQGHKGPVTVYYEDDGTWQHIAARFNGKGELVQVNGVRP